MNLTMDNKRHIVLYFFIGLMAMYVLFVADTLANTSFQFLKPSVVGTFNYDELKYTNYKNVNDENIIRFEIDIPSYLVGKTICVYTSDSFIDAKLNGDVIYSYGESTAFCKSPGSRFNFINLANAKVGDNLVVNIRGIYDVKFDLKPEIRYGDYGALMLNYIFRDTLNLVLTMGLGFLGFSLLVLSLISFLRQGYIYKKSFFAGLVALSLFAWSSCELFVYQFLFDTGTLQYFVYYIMIILIPINLMIYMNQLSEIPLYQTLYAHIIFSIVLSVLQLLDIKAYVEVLPFYLIVAFIILFLHARHYKDNRNVDGPIYMKICYILMILSIFINMIIFYANPDSHTDLATSKIGFMLYISVTFAECLKEEYRNTYIKDEEKRVNDMVYVDILTGLNNRIAFNRDISNANLEDVAIVSFDLNNLKFYNDTQGHNVGDALLMGASECLKNAFKNATIYRFGGDEFLGLYIGKTYLDYDADCKRLDEEIKRFEESCDDDIIIEISKGYASYRGDDTSYERILKRADDNMYRNKNFIKKHSRIDLGSYVDLRIH